MLMMIMIALKCTIRDFYHFLTVSRTYAQVARAQSCAIKFDRVEIAFILA